MKLTLPKPYLSYSALTLWGKNKEQFRDRYYRNIKSPDNEYSLFGREVHALIDTDPIYAEIRLPTSEQKMEVVIGGVPILGYLDTYDPTMHAFGEYKSSIRTPDGAHRWTKKIVDKHDQLPFYSLLLQEKYGVKINKTYLVYLETAWEEKAKKIGSVELVLSKKLVLTGHREVFPRRIFQRDRDRMKRWIIRSAKSISKDYEHFKNQNKV